MYNYCTNHKSLATCEIRMSVSNGSETFKCGKIGDCTPEQICANMKSVNIDLNIVHYCVKSYFMWCCSELFRTPIPLLVSGLLTYPDCSRDRLSFFF